MVKSMIESSMDLRESLRGLKFSEPVSHVYQPLDYAWRGHAAYLENYARSPKAVLFLGMNPGPYGMAQTGVPFGEVAAVRDWLGITAQVDRPSNEHPKRRIEGWNCARSEVSGRRLWGLFRQRFGQADVFFAQHFVHNFCPLVWMRESGANLTPEQLPRGEMQAVESACLLHLQQVIALLQPTWLIGIGGYAEQRLAKVAQGTAHRVGRILHPSPASPAANRDWAGAATGELVRLGVWEKP